MLHRNRIFWSQNGVLKDLSVNLSDIFLSSEAFNLVSSTDVLYLASDLPFNHRYVKPGVANSATSRISKIEILNNTQWYPVVDIMDQTVVSGATLGQSGVVSWVPDRKIGWVPLLSTEFVTELSSVTLYDLYWVKVTFSADLSGTTTLKYLGHRFSEDFDLTAQYPDLANTQLMSAFKAGKTDWADQAYIAAEYIIQDLRAKGTVTSGNQLLDWTLFKNASVHKTASLIYMAFGPAAKDKKDAADIEYKKSSNIQFPSIDKNLDGRLEPEEEQASVQSWVSR